MVGNWKKVSLEDIAAKTDRPFAMGPFGSNIKAENYQQTGVPIIRGGNLNDAGGPPFNFEDFVYLSEEKADELKSSNTFPGDIVFVAQGSVGRVGIVPFDKPVKRYVLSQNLMKASVDSKRADPLYVFYYFRSLEGQHEIFSRVNPTGVPCISQPLTSLKSFQIEIPEDIEEQRAIAHILGSLDNKIELNRKMNQTLEAMAQAIFKSWFVDFDPVRAKAEGRDPGLPPDLAALFPDRFEDSELGEIPKGWRVGTVVEEFNLTMGQSPPGETYNETDEGMPFYQGRADFGFRFPNHRISCTAPTRYAEKGDTLISVRAPVGDINMATEKCCIGRGVAAARHKTGSRSYTYYFMKSIDEVFARFEAEGTVFGSISKKDFHNIQCIIQPAEIIVAFERIAFPLDEQVGNNEQEIVTLRLLRDALLPKLLSGEIRVRT